MREALFRPKTLFDPDWDVNIIGAIEPNRYVIWHLCYDHHWLYTRYVGPCPICAKQPPEKIVNLALLAGVPPKGEGDR